MELRFYEAVGMEPAHSIIALFATDTESGAAVVSKITGTSYAAPYRWKRQKGSNGTGGTIPSRYQPALLSAAQARGLPLRPEHFMPGQTPSFGKVAA